MNVERFFASVNLLPLLMKFSVYNKYYYFSLSINPIIFLRFFKLVLIHKMIIMNCNKIIKKRGLRFLNY
jgi:hypothetical protein